MEKRDEGRWLVSRRTNAWSPDDCTLEYVRAELMRALRAVDAVSTGGTVVAEKHVGELKVAFDALHELHRYLPEVECWCVVKHYAGHVADVDPWEPRVWVGCSSREQAEELAPAIERHYARQDKESGVLSRIDRFKVERRGCSVSQILHPSVDAKTYLERL